MSIKPERVLLVGEWRYLPEQDKLVKPDESGKHYIPADLDNLCQKVANYFILNAGRLITKEELLQDVWGIKDVSDGRVTRVIRVLRVALGDNTREPKYIETIPKRGYRFIATVEELPESLTEDTDETPLLVATTETFSHSLLRYKWIILAVIAILMLFSWQLWLTPKDDLLTEQAQDVPLLRYKPVTAMDGLEFYHNVSADEQYLVFSYAANDKENVTVLLLQNLTTHQRIQLTDRSYSSFGAVFSPDGTRIAYHRMYPDERCEIRLLTLNDNKTTVLTDELLTVCGRKTVSARLSWSPDGRFLVYPSLDGGQKQLVLMLLPLSGGTAEQLTVPPASSFGDYAARFSRNGDKIAFLRASAGTAQIWILDLATRSTRFLVQVPEVLPGNIDWNLSDTAIIYPSGYSVLSSISLQSGNPKILAYTDNSANELQVSNTGKIYSSVGLFSRVNVKKVSNNITRRDKPSLYEPVFTSNRNESFVAANPVFGKPDAVVSHRSGLPQIWFFYSNGEQKQITFFDSVERIRNVIFSPDGEQLLIQLNNDLFLLDNAQNQVKITNKHNGVISNPAWSRDGKSIFYAESHQGRWNIMQVILGPELSTEVFLVNKELYQESYYGNYIFWRDADSKKFFIRYDGEHKAFELPIILPADQSWFRFELREAGVYFTSLVENNSYQLKYLELNNHAIRDVIDIEFLMHSRFSVSSDEKFIYILETIDGDLDIGQIDTEIEIL